MIIIDNGRRKYNAEKNGKNTVSFVESFFFLDSFILFLARGKNVIVKRKTTKMIKKKNNSPK